jgi:hypothetical protein
MSKIMKPTKRLTTATVFERGQNRQINVIVYPEGGTLGFKLKGMKTEFFLPIGQLYVQAVQRYAQTTKPARVRRSVSRSCL